MAERIKYLSLWVHEDKRGESCAKAALGYPSSHRSHQEPAAVGLCPGRAAVEVVLVSAANTPPTHLLGSDGTSLAPLGPCVRKPGRDGLKMKERIDISLTKCKIFTEAERLLEASFGNPFLPLHGAARHEGGIQ